MDICVGNLPRDVTENDLRAVFEWFGRVETADVVKPRRGDENTRLGFVGMPSHNEAAFAILGVHGRNINGQAITATEVRPTDPVSGACGTRCPCRSREQATGNADLVSAESRRQGGDNDESNYDLE